MRNDSSDRSLGCILLFYGIPILILSICVGMAIFGGLSGL